MLQRFITRRAARCVPPTLARCASLTAPLQRRSFLSTTRLRAQSDDGRTAFDSLNVERLTRKRQDYDRMRLVFLTAGAAAGLIATIYTAFQLKNALEEKAAKKLDAGPASSSPGSSLAARKVIVHDKDGNEVVPTGDHTVSEFPRTVTLAAFKDGDSSPTDYTLVGLGVRTVSFLSIRVYVVGYYIATADIAALQNRLVKRTDPIATTLVQSEKDELRTALLDPEKSYDIWDGLLQDDIPKRSLIRIVPVRDTDFHHLRDGLVRAIQARAPRILETDKAEKADSRPEFKESVRQMRRLFDHGKVPKGKELILLRGEGGRFSLFFDDGRPIGRRYIGSVDDERLSRALWLNYLGGGKVASEPARQSIVDGVIEFVERPIGTVATQVV